MSIKKTPTTLTIREDVKMKFKVECIKNSVEMSETVEQMMSDYIKVSQEIHALNESNK